MPSFETDRTETPSPVNSLGVKGIGEAGTIAASAAVTNAVIDALRPLGVTYINMPLTPMRVWEAIQEARRCGMIPAEFDYVGARHRSTRRSRLLREGGEDAKVLAGGHSLHPADEAAAGGARRCSSTCGACRGCSGVDRANGDVADRRDDARTRDGRGRGDLGLRRPAAATIADQQVRNRGTIGGSLAHGDPASDLPAVLLAAEGSVMVARARAASARSRPPTCSRTT